ncbi:hypothetical protein [Erysipelothrix anatis]|uniref:hypothetical protein n=1 Tax=Erysipelothrix anatis TaxID=2683713 RepID=UPI00135BD911|nr:hypothetical protein [Erysipelothrix anatis]
MIKQVIKKLKCDHRNIKYIGKNKKSIKKFKCLNCGTVGSSDIAANYKSKLIERSDEE